eukprot:TRINITY_DN2382_c0_g1_i1.p1 TRINITY_DN2382_c0_g1~~TRINITY_DN2382_c0_g1_i1.p1  ORF type:complete len:380 (+),score=65.73 TRINITY_DN2382_c0_g1_i1:38-1141(+)
MERLVTVDIFRGIVLTMMLIVNNAGSDENCYRLLGHAKWNGLTIADLVFPWFLFISGFCQYLSIQKSLKNSNKFHTFKKSTVRAFKLFLIGFGLNFISWIIFGGHLRVLGVLQRIALCNFILCTIALLCNHIIVVGVAFFGLCLVYICLMGGYFVDGCGIGNLTPFCSFESYFDRLILGNHTWKSLPYDPEGFVSTLSASCTIFIGYLTSYLFFQAKQKKNTEKSFVFSILIIETLVFVIGAFLFDRFTIFKVNKALWTPAFVSITAAFAIMMLMFLILFIENNLFLQKILFPFKAIGMNPLICFFGEDFLVWFLIKTKTYYLPYKTFSHFFPSNLAIASLLHSILHPIFWILIAVIMYNFNFFIKV